MFVVKSSQATSAPPTTVETSLQSFIKITLVTAVMESFTHILRSRISEDSTILTKSSPGFTAALERWSRIDLKIPALIVQPVSEQDVATLVSCAILSFYYED